MWVTGWRLLDENIFIAIADPEVGFSISSPGVAKYISGLCEYRCNTEVESGTHKLLRR